MDLQRYWSVVQQRICPRCLDGDGQGECRLPVDEECALKSFLPQIVATVAKVKASSIEIYVNALRKDVCSVCEHQGSDLFCKKRNDLECALDRYYPLVVEIVETVRQTMELAESNMGGHTS